MTTINTVIARRRCQRILDRLPFTPGGTLMAERLSDIAIQRELGNLPGWSRRGDVITKTYQFRNFMAGIDFVVAVAKAAEAADHHPDLDIRYTKIVCSLSTHSAGGITQNDLDLAKAMERLAKAAD
jgi:4a-hydroxytetrahydrobiopterin dehydratase